MAAELSPSSILRSASWNVLCDTYANHPASVAQFQRFGLDGPFSKREIQIAQSINVRKPETVQLQEVPAHAFSSLQNRFGTYGYQGYFARHKVEGENRTANQGAVYRDDGVAVFFKQDTFNGMQPQTYYDPIVGRACLIVTGTHTPTNQKVQIASAHIDGNPKDFSKGDGQLHRCLDAMERTQGVAVRILGTDLNQAIRDANLPWGHLDRLGILDNRGYSTPNPLELPTELMQPQTLREIRRLDYLHYKREAGFERAVIQDLSSDPSFYYSDHSMVVAGILLPSASQAHRPLQAPVALDDAKGEVPSEQGGSRCSVQ